MRNIDLILSDKKEWKKEKKNVLRKIQKNFEKPGFFNKRIDFFSNNEGYRYSMKIADYYINLMFWRPMIGFNKTFDQNCIIDLENINSGKIKNYIDKHYTIPYLLLPNIDRIKQNKELAILIENLKSIVEDFGVIMGISYNLYEVWQMMKNDVEFAQLVQTQIPEGLQPYEIENLLKAKRELLKEKLLKYDTGFKPLLSCGEGLSDNQLQEFMLVIGNKPDLKGNVLPKPINTNVFIQGINKPSDYLIDAIAGRKSLIMNKKFTGDSGYFSRKLMLNNMNIYLDPDENCDCHTKTLTKIKVEDEEFLRVLSYMYYKPSPNSIFYSMIMPDQKFLIGKYIYLRSPLTCAKKHGICKKCYGGLYYINREIHIGEYAASEMGSQFTQLILSAKHNLTTKSEQLVFLKLVFTILDLDNGFISLKDDVDPNYSIRINKRELMSEEVVDDEDDDDVSMKELMMRDKEVFTCSSFDIVDKKGNVIVNVKEVKNELPFILNDQFAKLIKKYDKNEGKYINIRFKHIIDSDISVLFTVDVLNNELTKTLGETKRLLENEHHMDCETRDEMLQKMIRLLINGKIKLHSTHSAVILRNLFRDANDVTQLPDYSGEKYPDQKGNPPYKIFTVKKSIFNHPSPIISIALETVNAQLGNVATYSKVESSFLDDMFRIRLKDQENINNEYNGMWS